MSELYLRPAAEEGGEILYEWRHDPETRQNSFHSEVFPFEAHMQWLRRVLSSSSERLRIMMLGAVPIGQVRLSVDGTTANISYGIAPAYRRQGYGARILQLIENELDETNNTIQILAAQVKKENIASQRIFEKLRYETQQRDMVICYQKKIY